MKTLQKLNRRGYGNRPFKNYGYIGWKLPSSFETIVEIEAKTPWWFKRFINFIKNLI